MHSLHRVANLETSYISKDDRFAVANDIQELVLRVGFHTSLDPPNASRTITALQSTPSDDAYIIPYSRPIFNTPRQK